MEPNLFRESRLSINRMYRQIERLIAKKAFEESLSSLEKVKQELAALTPEAEGEIQKRSVRNLGIRYNYLANEISKLAHVRPAGPIRSRKQASIQWDEERLGQLAKPYLEKLCANMAGDGTASVMLGTTGKGIRPNYQIRFGNGSIKGFTGSGHKPRKSLADDSGKHLSEPFSFEVISRILARP